MDWSGEINRPEWVIVCFRLEWIRGCARLEWVMVCYRTEWVIVCYILEWVMGCYRQEWVKGCYRLEWVGGRGLALRKLPILMHKVIMVAAVRYEGYKHDDSDSLDKAGGRGIHSGLNKSDGHSVFNVIWNCITRA